VAARGVKGNTGAAPAFGAVARPKAFSSLLSSLRGSHRFGASGSIYVSANRSGQIRSMQPQARRETAIGALDSCPGAKPMATS